MIEDITFQDDTEEKVSVTIDKETQELPIKKINKLSTYIGLNKSPNTALKNDIQVDAFIYYIKKGTEDIEDVEEIEEAGIGTKFLTATDDNKLSINIDGNVTITIYKDEEIYYIKDVKFIKGHIIDSIKNTLPLGEYLMTIDYAGNKYFESSSLSINFRIEKRLGVCTISKTMYDANYGDILTIEGIFADAENHIPIPQCILHCDFDEETYVCTTNNNGEFSFTITVPEPDISHCTYYFDSENNEYIFIPGEPYKEEYEEEIEYNDIDDDNISVVLASDEANDDDENNIQNNIQENITIDAPQLEYPRVFYVADIYIVDESYYLDETRVEVVTNKAPTMITVNSTNADMISNIMNLHGSILATYNNKDNDVKYGNIIIKLPDFNYSKKTHINDGVFNVDIDLPEVYGAYNHSDIDVLEPYDTTINMKTNIEVICNNEVQVGDTITATAKVSGPIPEEYIKYGVIIFSLFNKDTIIHQYAVEVDEVGVGTFYFDVSHKDAIYKIQAKYIGMFGYGNSESDKYEVRVK